MKTLEFKTSVETEGAIGTLSFLLDSESTIDDWNINIEDPNRTLTVSGKNLEPHTIYDLFKKAGFSAELITT